MEAGGLVFSLLNDECPGNWAMVEDLWFSRSGSDLTITLAGSDDQVTIEQLV
jgi:hypothetical protein